MEPNIQQACDYWVKKLGLQNWDIDIRETRKENFVQQECTGECLYSWANEQAIINILDPVDYINQHFEQDQEKTVVHEQLHLLFGSIMDDVEGTIREAVLHQIIGRLSRTLVSLKRETEEDNNE